MQYFVISDDGQKYGPADLMVLNQWVRENRLRPDTMLESVTTAERLVASTVIGLEFASSPPPTAPNVETPYATPNYYARPAAPVDPGSQSAQTALILGVLGLVFCPFFSIFALVFVSKAKKEGSSNTLAGTILGWLGVAVTIVGIFVFALVMGTVGLDELLRTK